MKHIFFLIFLGFASLCAQETVQDTSYWNKKGKFTLLANQSSFNNWLAGGQNNIAVNANINYDFNYKKDKNTWQNKLIVAYGITKVKDANILKSDDRLEWNSIYGRQARGNWYYSAFLNFKSQISTDLGNPAPGYTLPVTTKLFAPAFLQIGPGMLWKKSDNLKVNFAPATSRFVFVLDDVLSSVGAFGVTPGEKLRYELGASISGYYKFVLVENVTVENILNLYSNYLEKPENVDMDYQLNIAMKINKFLSANLAFQAIYDDNAFRGLQTRQVFGVGFNYDF
jgi:hypothetical protein